MTLNSSQPILSICIPTYNRAHYLRDALESISVQLHDEHTRKEVEVVIADNASTDATEAVVKEFANKIPHLHYIKNPQNVGFDGNVDIVVRAAHGTYCWYLGDDDALVNGALAHMIRICEESKYAIISVTDRPIIDRPIDTTLVSYSPADHVDGLSPSTSYLSGHLPSALSMLAFRRHEWLHVADFSEHTPGWYYFETLLRIAVLPNAQLLHIKKPMIFTGQDMRWADGGAGLKIFIDCNRFLHKMIDWGYDVPSITKEINDNARKFPIVLLQSKAKGLPFTRQNWKLLTSYTTHAPAVTRIASHILFFIPNPVVRIIRDLKKKLS